MCRGFLLAFLLCCALMAGGCGAQPVSAEDNGINEGVHVEPTGAAVDYWAIFQFKLYSGKHVYHSTEKINVWATLKYIGGNDQIQIWHAEPYVLFQLTGGRFDAAHTAPVQSSVLATTTLKKGELLAFPFQKSGGFDADKDPNRDFWTQYFSTSDLVLPPGTYTIRAFGAFTADRRDVNVKNNLIEEIHIKVTK